MLEIMEKLKKDTEEWNEKYGKIYDEFGQFAFASIPRMPVIMPSEILAMVVELDRRLEEVEKRLAGGT